jgi:pimeloyl-ACP methyl ester carboxylesterase
MRTLFIQCCLLAVCTSCSIIEIQNQVEIIDSVGIIRGKAKLTSPQKGGTYFIGAFIDSNNDGEYQPDTEDANYYSLELGKPTEIVVESGKTVTNIDLIISGKRFALSTTAETKKALIKPVENIGVVISLEDPVFVDKNYSMGLWRPAQFFEQVGGGLFFLQEYQQGKIPVLFIHGMGSGPVDWKQAIEKLDRRIIFYPTGLRLDMVSNYLVKSVAHLQGLHGFKRLYVAAHSMGGLVAHSFVKKYLAAYPDLAESISLVITVNSPMDGMKSALKGVKNSPIVLPVWRDVATGSQFIKGLNDWWWPEDIPYHLIFSYETGRSNDGTVSLQTQIPMQLQTGVTRLYGFNNSHVETLNDDSFLTLFNSILIRSLD